MSRAHENAYTHLEYAISENKGFVVITGEIGAGKTTLINHLLRRIGQTFQVGLVNHTNASPLQFIRMACQEFELDVEGLDKAEMLDRFHQFLLAQFSRRRRVILIIDEAQNLPLRTIEEIRMLSNLEAEKHHLIQMILAGQPELRGKLKRKALAQFAQRVTVHTHLEGLGEEEVGRYIGHRLLVAGGGTPDIFDKDAVAAVARHSRGIPRIINSLCDAALVYGFADNLKKIDVRVIEEVVKDRGALGVFDAADRPEPPAAEYGEPAGNAPLLHRLERIEQRLGELFGVIRSQAKAQGRRDEQFRENLIQDLRTVLAGDRRRNAQGLARADRPQRAPLEPSQETQVRASDADVKAESTKGDISRDGRWVSRLGETLRKWF